MSERPINARPVHTEMPPIEPTALVDRNIERFRDPQVVAEYAAASGPRDCEAALFATFIASGSDILDLGVGGGRTTAILAPLARNYLGVDYSEKMIEVARQKFPQYAFAVMDAADMASLASESFDVVLFSFNGLGFPYPSHRRRQCIHECHRLLRQGGMFIFSLHDADRLFLRPARKSRSLIGTLKAFLGALRQKATQGTVTLASLRGRGYIRISADGGVVKIFAASIAFVQHELSAVGFNFVSVYPVTENFKRWNYYVFRKGTSDRTSVGPDT